jgi:predicted ATP-binding protein involved in virulence
LKHVLSIYIEDSNEKLSTYDDLANKIELLLKIINERFLYKNLSIDKKRGFVFTSTISGKDIPLSGLSSGEQHELVLFFQLLFTTEPNSLLLIDEPEISLHISWQKELINDLRQVIRINNLSVIIATHSPDIIGNYWDLTVKLKGV